MPLFDRERLVNLTSELRKSVQIKMAKFRNRLVHLYWQVDNKQVYEILVKRRSDFKRFLDCMASFLGWNDPASAPN